MPKEKKILNGYREVKVTITSDTKPVIDEKYVKDMETRIHENSGKALDIIQKLSKNPPPTTETATKLKKNLAELQEENYKIGNEYLTYLGDKEVPHRMTFLLDRMETFFKNCLTIAGKEPVEEKDYKQLHDQYLDTKTQLLDKNQHIYTDLEFYVTTSLTISKLNNLLTQREALNSQLAELEKVKPANKAEQAKIAREKLNLSIADAQKQYEKFCEGFLKSGKMTADQQQLANNVTTAKTTKDLEAAQQSVQDSLAAEANKPLFNPKTEREILPVHLAISAIASIQDFQLSLEDKFYELCEKAIKSIDTITDTISKIPQAMVFGAGALVNFTLTPLYMAIHTFGALVQGMNTLLKGINWCTKKIGEGCAAISSFLNELQLPGTKWLHDGLKRIADGLETLTKKTDDITKAIDGFAQKVHDCPAKISGCIDIGVNFINTEIQKMTDVIKELTTKPILDSLQATRADIQKDRAAVKEWANDTKRDWTINSKLTFAQNWQTGNYEFRIPASMSENLQSPEGQKLPQQCANLLVEVCSEHHVLLTTHKDDKGNTTYRFSGPKEQVENVINTVNTRANTLGPQFEKENKGKMIEQHKQQSQIEQKGTQVELEEQQKLTPGLRAT